MERGWVREHGGKSREEAGRSEGSAGFTAKPRVALTLTPQGRPSPARTRFDPPKGACDPAPRPQLTGQEGLAGAGGLERSSGSVGGHPPRRGDRDAGGGRRQEPRQQEVPQSEKTSRVLVNDCSVKAGPSWLLLLRTIKTPI